MTKIKQFIKKYEKMPVVARASLWFVICGFMTRGVSLLTTPIFTRLLTTEQYGVYSVFNSWLEIVTIFASLKLGYGVHDCDKSMLNSSAAFNSIPGFGLRHLHSIFSSGRSPSYPL